MTAQPYEAWAVLAEYTSTIWTDITSRVDTARMHFTATSGDTPEASADTGGMALPIRNHDQAFTPDNPLSSMALRPGMRVRIRETVLDQVFDRFTGRVEYPEIEAWTESNTAAPRDQLIVVPLIDEVAWLARGRKFISTLAEHIIFHGGPSLIAYWPMGEAEGRDAAPAVGAPWTITQTKRFNGYAGAPTAGPASIAYGAQAIAPADDLTSIEFSPSTTATPSPAYVTSLPLIGTRPTPLTLAAGQVVTVVCWIRAGALVENSVSTIKLIDVYFGDGVADMVAGVHILAVPDSGKLAAVSNAPDWSGSVTGPPTPTDQPIPVAVRVGFDPAVLELWVRGEVYTGTLTVTSATPIDFDVFGVGERFPGAVNHAQLYLGDATDWTHDDFAAQYEMGLYGLERQTTGERIRTVLQYAGVDPSELGRIDDGSSLMQVASLAGRGPIDLITDAVNTEQGEFYADGSGLPVFADRVRLYNI